MTPLTALRQSQNLLLYLGQILSAGGAMPQKLTEKQKATLWLQRRAASYQASCRLSGYTLTEPAVTAEQAEDRLASLRRQYGG